MSIAKEIFGIDTQNNKCECWCECAGCVEGFNKCVALIDQYELSEEELFRIIWKSWNWPRCKLEEKDKEYTRTIAKAIIQNKNKIFVRKETT